MTRRCVSSALPTKEGCHVASPASVDEGEHPPHHQSPRTRPNPGAQASKDAGGSPVNGTVDAANAAMPSLSKLIFSYSRPAIIIMGATCRP